MLSFPQVGLRFDEVCLERCPGLLWIQLGSTGLESFLELPIFRDKDVGDADNLPFCDWLARRGRIIHALVQPRVEALDGLVGIVGFPEILVVLVQVRGQDPCVVHVQVVQELERGHS